jgi:hypothetical protein
VEDSASLSSELYTVVSNVTVDFVTERERRLCEGVKVRLEEVMERVPTARSATYPVALNK